MCISTCDLHTSDSRAEHLIPLCFLSQGSDADKSDDNLVVDEVSRRCRHFTASICMHHVHTKQDPSE